MRQSDAALTTIRSTLDGWDRQEYFESLEQYKRFKQIRNRIVDARTRTWAEHPPWVKEDTETYNGIHEKDGLIPMKVRTVVDTDEIWSQRCCVVYGRDVDICHCCLTCQ
jgi:hypothetical protein